ncbi:MAG: HAMP domain-containing histidine kinase [Clostridia bacterium]|nr:HAMP domain-containing histidine kinase [Clostridia bacterium]
MAEKFREPGVKVKVRKSSLFRKFFFTSVIPLLVSLVIAGSSLLILVTNYWMNEKTVLLQESAMSVAQNTSEVLYTAYSSDEDREAPIIMICNNLNQISSAIDADVFIVNTQGRVLYCKETLSSGFLLRPGNCRTHSGYVIGEDILKTALVTNYRGTGDLDGAITDPSFIVSSPVVVDGETTLVVFVTQSFVKGLAPYLVAIFRMFVFGAVIGIIVASIFSYGLTAKTTRPLRLMSAAVRQYANGDFSARIPERKRRRKKDDEIDTLITAFNSMAQALATLESSRRSFIANVSHELKTPMTTIGGFIDGILDGTISEDKHGHYLSIVSGEIKRLRRLVEQMLNLSRIESGEVTLNPSDFDISEMIVTTLLSFEQIIESRNIEIRGIENIGKNNIYADHDMIYQVIYNLVDNAVKYTPDGGYIEVAASGDDENVTVRITNSGRGIESEEIDKVFERFYKVDKSRSYDAKSAGMGLFLVKTIVELHNGRIRASSVVDDHTDFIFRLPREVKVTGKINLTNRT